MKRPRICGVITNTDSEVVATATPLVDLFELRIDLVGGSWPDIAQSLTLPWIATVRRQEDGGQWTGTETERLAEIKRAIDLGASIVDLELSTPGLQEAAILVKKNARCLISHHDFSDTPSAAFLEGIISSQLRAGADICKLVTTAAVLEDSLRLLELYRQFPGISLVAFAMGPAGAVSRILAPLANAEFTYAALARGQESASGQPTVQELRRTYSVLGYD